MIFFEGKPDGVLLKVLGFSRKQIKNATSKGEVCNRLNKEQRASGLVDQDPGSSNPSYYKRLQLQQSKYKLNQYQDSELGNQLIEICPRLEEWILALAKQQGVDPRSFGLPDTAKKLHDQVNKKLDAFRKFVDTLQVNSDELELLRSWLNGE